jgi:hypothetical protein
MTMEDNNKVSRKEGGEESNNIRHTHSKSAVVINEGFPLNNKEKSKDEEMKSIGDGGSFIT